MFPFQSVLADINLFVYLSSTDALTRIGIRRRRRRKRIRRSDSEEIKELKEEQEGVC